MCADIFIYSLSYVKEKMNTEFILLWLKMYLGNGLHWVVFLVSIFILIIYKNKRPENKMFILYTVVWGILYAFPLTAYVIAYYLIGDNVYWRMFWLLPSTIIIAFAATFLAGRLKKELKYGIAVLGICLLIILTGNCIYGKGQFSKQSNRFKVPNKVIAACNIIRENSTDGEMIKAVGGYDFICYMRQYDAGIYQPYGRYSPGYDLGEIIWDEFEKEEADITVLTNACMNCRTNFIIYPSNKAEEQEFIDNNYNPIGKVEEYTIYKFNQYVPE